MYSLKRFVERLLFLMLVGGEGRLIKQVIWNYWRKKRQRAKQIYSIFINNTHFLYTSYAAKCNAP